MQRTHHTTRPEAPKMAARARRSIKEDARINEPSKPKQGRRLLFFGACCAGLKNDSQNSGVGCSVGSGWVVIADMGSRPDRLTRVARSDSNSGGGDGLLRRSLHLLHRGTGRDGGPADRRSGVAGEGERAVEAAGQARAVAGDRRRPHAAGAADDSGGGQATAAGYPLTLAERVVAEAFLSRPSS